MRKDARIFVAEPEGMLGRSIVRALTHSGLERSVLESSDVDLTDPEAVEQFFRGEGPSHVFLAAGQKGGILYNQRFPADLLLNNLRVAINVLNAARTYGTEKLLYVGSSCMYPRDCPQPMREEMLLTGPLEATSEAYAMGKLAGLQLGQAIRRQYGCRFISAIPTNIYGPGDCFDPDNAHVVGALIHKIAAACREGAPEVELWGTGSPLREFLYRDDFGAACVFLMERYEDVEPINIASGESIAIRDLARLIGAILGYAGTLRFDASKPDGAPHKSLDGSRLQALGWKPAIGLADGLRQSCEWYLRRASVRKPDVLSLQSRRAYDPTLAGEKNHA